MLVYSVGHGTRTLQELIGILQRAQVDILVDVRSFPRSRRNAQFNTEMLMSELPAHGVEYVHMVDLGGRRSKIKDASIAELFSALRVSGFANYGAYMYTSSQFSKAYEELCTLMSKKTVAFMCAETLYWKCHRRMLSDRLETDGHTVVHLGMGSKTQKHERWSLAKLDRLGKLIYR